MASGLQIAAHLFLSEVRFRELVSQGVLPKKPSNGYDIDAVRKIYILHLRERAAGRQANKGEFHFTDERARLAKEQADGMALKNAVVRGEYVSAKSVERRWSETFGQIRAAILAIPSRVSQRLGHLTLHDVDVIDREIREALTTAVDDASNPGSRSPPRRSKPEAAEKAEALGVD